MKSVIAGLFLSCITSIACAGTIGFTFNAGPVIFVENGFVDPEVEAFQDFQLDESVMVSFSIDDATIDIDPDSQRGEFEDPNGQITLTGSNSGATIEMRKGVNIQLDSVLEFDLRNILVGPELHVFELFDDTDYLASVPIISNPDNLATSIAELAALLDANNHFPHNNLSSSSFGSVGALDSLGPFIALEFGPVAPVPALPAYLLTLFGLLAMAQNKKIAH